MKFTRLEMLFLIWTLPVFLMVFIYGMRKRRKTLNGYAQPKSLAVIVPGNLSNRRRLKAGLMLSVLFFITIALSGPQYGYKWQEIERKGIDIIIALDCSKSMLATDISPTRLARAKREVYDLLNLLKGDRIGLVAFAGTAFLQAPLTLDYNGFHIFLTALSPDYLPVGGTDISQAISSCLASFDSKNDSEKAIILITDGENTGEEDPMDMAKEAQKAGVKLFCVGVGNLDGVPIPGGEEGFKKDASGKIVLTKLDEDMLKKIAALTGGTYVRSIAGDMDLDIIYTKEIRGKMTRSTLESSRKQVWEDRFQWFVALAVAACIIECLLPAMKKQAASVFLLVLFLLVSAPSHASDYRKNMQSGLDAYQKEDFRAAVKGFTDAQLENPDKSEIWYNLGNSYYKLGDYDTAETNYRQALTTENQELKEKTYYNLGNTTFRKKRYDDAINHYRKALELDPDDIQAKQNLAYAEKMKALQQQKQQQKQGKSSGNNKDDGSREDTDSTQKNNQDTSGQEESPQPQKTENNPQDKQDQSSRPSYGKEMEHKQQSPSDGNQAAQESEPAGGTQQDSDKGDSVRQQAGKPMDTDERNQAERILNRLEDQPGRAMIPFYRKKTVEKDW